MYAVRTHSTRVAALTCALALALFFAAAAALAQSVQTTTVQGTVYTAGGAPTAGTLQITWPAFTTAGGQAIAAGRTIVNIPANGQINVALAPNIGATPAGLYYTAVYHLSDGGTSTEYWVVPNTLQVTLASVRATVMPAAQAVQAVSKTYVDQSIQQAVSSQITPSGGTLTGPLYLAGDPNSPAQAANKHYVDSSVAGALPIGGGVLSGPVTATQIGAVYQADQFPGNDFGAQLQACLNALNPSYGGTCDARNFAGSLSMGANLTVSSPNVTIYLPCSTIATAASIVVPAGTRNVAFHGCASRGTSAASGTQGGTVLLYSGNSALLQVGDPGYVADTKGFHMDNAALNTTPSGSAAAQAVLFFRTQEISLSELYLLGNSNQTALTLDGTGNYTGGTFEDLQITGYQTAVNGIGHTVDNPAATDWLNASTFVRLHVDCPTQNGNPISGATGINLLAGDGNTFTGGDIESCATALHLGPHAQNNTIVGLRNENSSNQVIADSGSSYNNWITGGTMFTGKLTDNGTRNSFLDTFHRSFNGLNGDWYGSQQDLTVTNHFRLGIGSGNERGLLNRYQTDSGYRWTTGISDATSGEQYYQVLDELNNVYRLSIGQYNNGQASTNNQTGINAAGTGAVILNGSNNAGTGGVVFGSGGPASTTVATVDKAGNAHFTGTLLTDSTAQSTGTLTVRNNADSEVDYYLWPGLTTSQKGSFTYKDFNGASQWYMVKDASNNWALNSAIGGLDSIKAYQSSNSGDTYINAANPGGAVRINYETGAGAAFNIYGGSSSTLYAGFTAPNVIKFPGLAAASGKNCLQIDNSGYISNTTSPCSSGVGTVSTGTGGQIAYYTANGTAIGGTSTIPLGAGGTGSATASGALANLGAVPLAGGTMTGPLTATQFNGPVHGDVTGNLSGNVTFTDSTVQTTSQQGALTGSANDAMARGAASTAQATANTAQSTATAALTAASAAQAANDDEDDEISAAQAIAGQAETDAQTGITAAAAAQTAAGAALPANGCTTSSGGRLNCSAVLSSVTPAIDVDAFLSASDGHSGQDYCNAINTAVATVATGGSAALRLSNGTHKCWTPAVINRSAKIVGNSVHLVPQSGGAGGVWGAAPTTLSSVSLTLNTNITGTPVTGSYTFTVPGGCAALPAAPGGTYYAVHVGGVGLPPDDYIVSCSGSTATLAEPAELVPACMGGGTTILGPCNSLTGITSSNTVRLYNGTLVAITAVDSVHNKLALASTATNAGNLQTYPIGGAISTTLTAEVAAPVLSFQWSSYCMQNADGQCIGMGLEHVNIDDPAGQPGRSISGAQGLQIAGVDRFTGEDFTAQGLMGSGLILGGAGFNSAVAGNKETVRESYFSKIQIRDSGDRLTRQSGIVLATGMGNNSSGTIDEINQIGCDGCQSVFGDWSALHITTHNNGNWQSNNGPRLIWFNGPNNQMEAGSYQTASPNAPCADLIRIDVAQDFYFGGGEINGPDCGRADLAVMHYARKINVMLSRMINEPQTLSYTVSTTAGGNTLTFVSATNPRGATSFGGGDWNGRFIQITGTVTCTTSSPCNYWLDPSAALSNTRTLQLPAGATTPDTSSSATMYVGAGGEYFLLGAAPGEGLTSLGNDYNGHVTSATAINNAQFGLTAPDSLFFSGSGVSNPSGSLSYYLHDFPIGPGGTVGGSSPVPSITALNANIVTGWVSSVASKYNQTNAATVSAAGTCNSAAEGTRRAVSDSQANTYGATITGGGSYHVPAYCNGTNWVVD